MRQSPSIEPEHFLKVSVLMPAFNESQHIVANLREVVATFDAFDVNYEVIVIDDGSVDSTHIRAARVAVDHPERVRIVRCDLNRGKGNALICGMSYVHGDFVVFLDADMDLHPSQLQKFFEIMKRTGADAVIGSKWHPESRVNYPPIRKLYSLGYFAFVRALFRLPLRDTQTGLKVFRTRLLRDVFPRVLGKRFCFDIELLAIAHHRGYRIVDAPVALEFRRALGRIKAPVVWQMLLETLAVFYRLNILRYYDRALPPEELEEANSYEVLPEDCKILVANEAGGQ